MLGARQPEERLIGTYENMASGYLTIVATIRQERHTTI
jgi:hypothetical protein